MNIQLTEEDKNNIKKAFNLLIEAEQDTQNYSSLFLRLGINSLNVKVNIKDFQDSHEENDLIGNLLKELLKEKGINKTSFVEYHAVSDGRHKVFIDEEEAFNIDAWNTESDLKERFKDWLIRQEIETPIKTKEDVLRYIEIQTNKGKNCRELLNNLVKILEV